MYYVGHVTYSTPTHSTHTHTHTHTPASVVLERAGITVPTATARLVEVAAGQDLGKKQQGKDLDNG